MTTVVQERLETAAWIDGKLPDGTLQVVARAGAAASAARTATRSATGERERARPVTVPASGTAHVLALDDLEGGVREVLVGDHREVIRTDCDGGLADVPAVVDVCERPGEADGVRAVGDPEIANSPGVTDDREPIAADGNPRMTADLVRAGVVDVQGSA